MRAAATAGGTIGAVTDTAGQPAIADADATSAAPEEDAAAGIEMPEEDAAAGIETPVEDTAAEDAEAETEDAPAAAEAPPEDTAAEAPPEDTAAEAPPEDTEAEAPPEDTEAETEDAPAAAEAPPEDTDEDDDTAAAAELPAEDTPAEAEDAEAPDGTPSPAVETPADDAVTAPDVHTDIGTPIPSVGTTGGLNSGDIVAGPVSSVEKRELELDLGSGRVGVIGSRHWSTGLDVDLTGEVKIGDIVEAAVLVREDHKQRIVLSRSWGRQQRAWDLVLEAKKTGGIVTGVVTDAVAAGLTVDIGVRAFVPASMAGTEDMESLVGTTVECKVTEVNQLKGRCILSRRAALRTRHRQEARQRLAKLSPGTVLQVRVTKVEDFGALVLADGDLRGRIRRNELSWFRVRRPPDIVAVGDELEARVLATAPAKMSMDLSLRLGEDPLRGIARGERHQATVTALAPFGAFVRVDDRIEGLVPTAELAEYPIRHPRDVVVPGDSLLAEVTKVDRQRRDLELSVNLAMLVRPAGEE